MCMMFSQCNNMFNGYTCIPYDTISRGVWPHRGPCILDVATVYYTCVLIVVSFIVMVVISSIQCHNYYYMYSVFSIH